MLLTSDQNTAVSNCVALLSEKYHSYKPRVYRLGGYAGTGKTTCAESIVHMVSNSISCAYTGKASWRLIEKGVPGATTIHKAIYRYDIKRKKFFLKDEVLGEYFLVDEGSMIGAKIWADLLSFRKPIIVIGDPGQLQPVADDDPHLMHDPDYVLTKVHRQAMLSGITQLATNIREQHQWQSEYPDVTLRTGRRDRQVTNDDLMTHDVVLCGWNDTRVKLNEKYRRLKGYTGLLVNGERIIILRNNYDHSVFNGQMFTVLGSSRVNGKFHIAECVDDMGTKKTFKLTTGQFHNPKSPKFAPDQSFVHADYGYAITVHKSQGSEWDNVLVVDEDGGDYWDQTRWRYTAVTRAAKNLTLLSKGYNG